MLSTRRAESGSGVGTMVCSARAGGHPGGRGGQGGAQGGGGGRHFLLRMLGGDLEPPGGASRRRAAAGISADLGHPPTRPSASSCKSSLTRPMRSHRSHCRLLRRGRCRPRAFLPARKLDRYVQTCLEFTELEVVEPSDIEHFFRTLKPHQLSAHAPPAIARARASSKNALTVRGDRHGCAARNRRPRACAALPALFEASVEASGEYRASA